MKIKTETKTISKHEDVVVIEVFFEESFTVVALGEGLFPSVILEFENSKNKKEKIAFEEFKGFKIWCCESYGESLRICLLKGIKNNVF